MSMYNFNPEDAIRFANEQGIKVKNHVGNELRFINCPYCGKTTNDKNTFSINLKTGQFKCLRATCGAKGNMITLSKDFNFSLGTQVDEYYQKKRTYRKIKRPEKKIEPKDPAIKYLESRGIGKEVASKYEITVRKDADNILVFPFFDDNGELCFIKYRKTDFDKTKDNNKEWCEKNCKPILFGMKQVNPENKTLILTEGQIDSLSVAEAGIENAVSVPTGAKGFTWIPYCWDFLGKFETLIVFGDREGDEITLLDEMKHRFNGVVKYIRPEDYLGCKDANEILNKHGKDAIVKAVNNAAIVQSPKIKSLVDVKRKDLSDMDKIDSGIESLDKLLGGFYFGQVVLVTGERGFGKSTLVSQFGTRAIDADKTTFFYSGELMDWYFKAWIEYQMAGNIHINPVKEGAYYSVDKNVIKSIESWYADKAYIYDNGIVADGTEEETLLQTLEKAVIQYNCKVLVIDNLMTAISDDLSSDLYRMQTKFVRSLTLLAKEHNVLVFLIVHPRKSNGLNFDNDDVAGSSNITNLVDVVMRYGKPKDDNISADTSERVLSVYKNRLTGRTNREGIRLYFQESSKRISEDPNYFDWQLGWDKGEGFEKVQEELVFD